MAKKQLFNLPDTEIQHWECFKTNNTKYDFGHLDAYKHIYTHPERNESYTLYFTFSHHVFTRSIKETEKTDIQYIYPYKVDERFFDLDRFKLSINLPQIVKTLPQQFCYHGGHSRYCSCEVYQEDGSIVNYQVVYRVWKKSSKMRFHIESAYPLTKPFGKAKKVNFWVICHNLLKGKKLPKPPM